MNVTGSPVMLNLIAPHRHDPERVLGPAFEFDISMCCVGVYCYNCRRKKKGGVQQLCVVDGRWGKNRCGTSGVS